MREPISSDACAAPERPPNCLLLAAYYCRQLLTASYRLPARGRLIMRGGQWPLAIANLPVAADNKRSEASGHQ